MSETIEELKKKILELEERNKMYENGDAKLYYALQRKMSEMAAMLNNQDLTNVDLVKKADSTFDRIFKLLEKCEAISNASKSLGIIAGVTGNEDEDTTKKPFVSTIADSRH